MKQMSDKTIPTKNANDNQDGCQKNNEGNTDDFCQKSIHDIEPPKTNRHNNRSHTIRAPWKNKTRKVAVIMRVRKNKLIGLRKLFDKCVMHGFVRRIKQPRSGKIEKVIENKKNPGKEKKNNCVGCLFLHVQIPCLNKLKMAKPIASPKIHAASVKK